MAELPCGTGSLEAWPPSSDRAILCRVGILTGSVSLLCPWHCCYSINAPGTFSPSPLLEDKKVEICHMVS